MMEVKGRERWGELKRVCEEASRSVLVGDAVAS